MKVEFCGCYVNGISDLSEFHPEDPEEVVLDLLLKVCVDKGSETFVLRVCTPKWLRNNLDRDELRSGQYHLIIDRFDYRRLIEFLESYCAGVRGENWEEVLRQLNRLAHWIDEFPDDPGHHMSLN